jgi:hypothetical protein
MSADNHNENRLFQAQNTLALLSLMGFDGLEIREDAYVSFRFCGEVFETARMEGRACLGLRRDIYSFEEYEAVMKTGDDMMGTNPDLQCLFSDCNCARIRLWVPCADANGYESALLGAMDRMDAIRSEFESRVQRRLFAAAAPVFESILHKR